MLPTAEYGPSAFTSGNITACARILRMALIKGCKTLTLIIIIPNSEGLLFMADRRRQSRNGDAVQWQDDEREKLLVLNQTVVCSTNLTRMEDDAGEPYFDVALDVSRFHTENIELFNSHSMELLTCLPDFLATKFNAALQKMGVSDLPTWEHGYVALQTILAWWSSSRQRFEAYLLQLQCVEPSTRTVRGAFAGSLSHLSFADPQCFGNGQIASLIRDSETEPYISHATENELELLRLKKPAAIVSLSEAERCAARIMQLTSEYMPRDAVGTLVDRVLLTPGGLVKQNTEEVTNILAFQ